MLDVAIGAAKIGGAVALNYFQKQPKVFYKMDKSPVTEADRETELIIRKIISKKFPDHGFIGEEYGSDKPKAQYHWVIDPIDGTKGFIRGMKTWGVLVALLKGKTPIVGVYASPATNELFWAEKNKGSFLNGKKLQVSKIKKLSEAYIIYGAINYFNQRNKLKQLVHIAEIAQGRRGSSDSDAFKMLLLGQADVFMLCHTYIHDVAAHSILIEEAGGRFSDFDGKFSLTSDNGIATNGLLHNQVLDLLNSK